MSMGWTAARKLRRVVANAGRVIGIELVCAAAGLDVRAPLRPAPGTAAAHDVLRARIADQGVDRVVAPDLAAADGLVTSGAILSGVAAAIGPLV